MLHAVVSSVYSCRRRAAVTAPDSVFDISDSVVSFNNVPASVSSSTFQMHLLRLVLSVVGLEHQLIASRIEALQVQVPHSCFAAETFVQKTTVLLRCIVVRTLVLAGGLSLSCARLMDGCLTTLWVQPSLSVNQQSQLSLPSLRRRLNDPIIWVTKGGDLCTADWAAWPAGAPAYVCRLHAAAVRSTALVSDEKCIRGVCRTRRCAIQIDNLYLYFLPL